jgi:drug/metabolite transporter (DMT)-like permease
MSRSRRSRSPEGTAYLALTGMALGFGGTWVAGSWAADAAPAFTVAAARFALASILLLTWTRLARRHLAPVHPTDLPLIAGLGLTAIAGYNWLFLTGLTLAPATDGALIVPGLAPVATTVLAIAFLRERIGARAAAGLALAIGGLVIVIGPSGGAEGTRLSGDLMFVAGAGLWGIYSVLARVASARFDPVSATLYGTLTGTAVLVPLAIAEGGLPELLQAPATGWIGLGYLAVLGTVVAFVLLQVGVARIGAARASAFALLIPIVGVLSSAAILGEPLRWATAVGGAAVLIGLWLVQRQPQIEPVLEPAASTEVEDQAHENGGHDGHDHEERDIAALAGNGDVHAPDAGDQGQRQEDDAHRGEHPQHAVQPVGEDRLVR